jgi:hypothetical protein
MLGSATSELLRLHPTLDDLIRLLSDLGDRPADETVAEIRQHLALRVIFLLLSETEGAPNYQVLRKRIENRLQVAGATGLVDALASIRAHILAADIAPRSGLEDLTHTLRQALLKKQGDRCAVCGWHFHEPNHPGRIDTLSGPTLDHRVPYRLGGDQTTNIWILCHLCNAIKHSRLHVGEHGPVWTNNYVYWSRQRAVAFWVMMRDRQCRWAACTTTAATSRLLVVRIGNRGAWVFDNCVTVCETHLADADGINY